MKLQLEQQEFLLTLLARAPVARVKVNATSFAFCEGTRDGARVELSINGEPFGLWRTLEGDRVHVKLGHRVFSVGLQDLLQLAATGASGDEVRADMPGVVVALRCAVGAHVQAGDPLLVIESMKMQLTLNAPRAGTIAAVHVSENQTFQKGAVLVALQPGDPAA